MPLVQQLSLSDEEVIAIKAIIALDAHTLGLKKIIF
jgi:hypothetical protein